MLKVIVKSVILFIILIYLAWIVKKTILKVNAGQIISNVKDKPIIYKKIVNNNDIYNQLSDLFFYSIILGGVIMIALSHGVQTTTILTILGSIGLALALSSQQLLNNIISGIKLAFTQTIKIGDVIELKVVGIPANTVKGKVTDINLFNTKISLVDTNEQLTVPNSIVENTIIINSSIIYN